MIGNAKYQCSCVRYLTQDNTALIVGIIVAVALLLVIIVIIIGIVVYRRHQSKLAKQRDSDETSMEQDNKEREYSRRLPDNYIQQESDL